MATPLEVAWSGIAGLCGGIVYLIVKQHVDDRSAVVVCVVSGLFGIFLGQALGAYFGIPAAGPGFICGIAAMKISIALVDGTAVEVLKRWIKKNVGD
jgi:hypothetical protein